MINQLLTKKNIFLKTLQFFFIIIFIIIGTHEIYAKTDTNYFIAKKQYLNHKYTQAIHTFYKVITNKDTKPKKIKNSKLYIIIIQYKLKNFKSALNNINTYTKTYKTDKYTNYAYYLKSILEYTTPKNVFFNIFPIKKFKRDQNATKQSLINLKLIKKNCKDKILVKKTNNKIAFLKEEIINHELNVAEYYMERKIYSASINRINSLDKNYKIKNSLKYKELYILTKSYNETFLNKNAKVAIKNFK
ncbi:MAG: outer membrane protein assembly factor BamD [Enterobacteriaceae bacterium]|nr:outer membrane protein assembly factor BamD [Enterobacteriaceae bacterium]